MIDIQTYEELFVVPRLCVEDQGSLDCDLQSSLAALTALRLKSAASVSKSGPFVPVGF